MTPYDFEVLKDGVVIDIQSDPPAKTPRCCFKLAGAKNRGRRRDIAMAAS